tara:strand:+ start:3953 stop:5200 length:1248 start_codon:yes stop_codon:yes gene_type:complete
MMGRRNKRKTRKQQRKNKKNTGGKNMKPITNTTTKKNKWDKTSCHTGQKPIFTTSDGITFFGGGKNRAGGWHKMSPLPDLAMGPSETMHGTPASSDDTTVPDGFSCAEFVGSPEPEPLFIHLDFPDFGIPASPVLFWYALLDDIREHKLTRVSVQCAGGHGRTGVQLCIFRYLTFTTEEREASGITTAGQLIDWVRDAHCHHAVETTAQQQYIADVCDLPVGEAKIEKYSTSYYTGYNPYKKWGDTHFESATGSQDDDDICEGCGNFLSATDYEYGDCPSCGLAIGGAPDVKIYVCPACGNDHVDDYGICMDCDYDTTREAESKDKKICLDCDRDLNVREHYIEEGDDSCASCTVERANAELRTGAKPLVFKPPKKDNEATVQCTVCLKHKPVRYIYMIDTTDSTVTCFDCKSKN